MLPRRGLLEHDESYHHDRSIGIEYSSRPLHTIREALFAIKGGLRKSVARYRFEQAQRRNGKYTLFFAGTWRDRFAATHFHVGLGREGIDFADAVKLARHLHGHLPFLIALLANSPVRQERLNGFDSNRFLLAERRFFYPLEFGVLDRQYMEEMTLNRSRKKPVPTLEIRPCDANLPEYVAAGLVVIKAATMAWLARRPVANHNSHERHLRARMQAAKYGPRATLYWNNRPLSAGAYADRFFREYGSFLAQMDIPPEVCEAFKLFRLGWNGAGLLRRACQRHQRRHPRVWRRHFAEEYVPAIAALLNGETLRTFARALGLRPPVTDGVRLGGRKW
jgi:gamma-glutamyl:cysteine ligase YbdK (ATP-grasp superfamily)